MNTIKHRFAIASHNKQYLISGQNKTAIINNELSGWYNEQAKER